MFVLVYTVRVIKFYASITHACTLQMICTMYIHTYKPMPPALCLGTPVPRQKRDQKRDILSTCIKVVI